MSHLPLTKHENSATMPYRKIKVKDSIIHIIHLPGGQRVICYSLDGTFRVLDFETGTQVKQWDDKYPGVAVVVLSPSGKTVVTSGDDAVKLWDVNTGKVIKTLTAGYTRWVRSVCWSPDGGRVASGEWDGTFRVWDVKSGKSILPVGPTNLTKGSSFDCIRAVCYSPDGKMIATTTGIRLEIWDANSGELLKTLKGSFLCLAWTWNGKTLLAGADTVTKFDTTTWSQIAVIEVPGALLDAISLSPNARILAGTSRKTAYLWNLETDQLIKTLYHAEILVLPAQPTFSTDGKFLVTSCSDCYLYTWDVSAIIKEADLPLDILDAPPQPAVKKKGAPHIPPGFSDDDPQKANSRIEVPYTASKPRNHHARKKKPVASSSRPSNTHTTQQQPSTSSQLPPPTATALTLSAVTGTAGASGSPHTTDIGWCARFVGWICCASVQDADGHH